jgi:RimJ/RimL family protein N-acetyltransferase
MRENWNTSIVGAEKVVLVPYRRKFVAKYHDWMKDPFLLETTASEPLSIEEEYEMQESWHKDPKKVTFIVLSKELLELDKEGPSSRETNSMIGDVNLFLNDYDDPFNAEIEIMIAEASFRRKGCAREALKLMMHYAVTQLKMKRFFAKIGEANTSSIELFKR